MSNFSKTISCGFNNWRDAEEDYYPKQGLTLHYSKSLSYFSIRLAFSYYSVWFLFGWSWMWANSKVDN